MEVRASLRRARNRRSHRQSRLKIGRQGRKHRDSPIIFGVASDAILRAGTDFVRMAVGQSFSYNIFLSSKWAI